MSDQYPKDPINPNSFNENSFNNNSNNNFNNEPSDEKLGLPLTIVSGCIPLVGIILFFVNKKDHPQKSKTACIAAIVGFVIAIILNVIVGGMGMLMNSGNQY